ncbi:porin family protein [bacterium]|nr:porin family protein [bacterium]MBU1957394.1 porin family protein [bacterium]
MRVYFYSTILLSVFSYAGGDIVPVELEMKDAITSNNIVKVEPIQKESLIKNSTIDKKVDRVKNFTNPQKYYIGILGAEASFDGKTNNGVLKNGHPLGIIAKVGYNVSNYLALETRAGVGLKKDTVSQGESQWQSLFGVYVKPKINLNKNMELFGLIGYGAVKQKINSSTIHANGSSYGAGASYHLNQDWSMAVDAVRYASEDDYDVDAYALGLEYRF